MTRLFAAILLATGFLATVTPASAQVARDGNFYEEVKFANCNATSNCSIEFSATPQLILFSKINCVVSLSNGAVNLLTFQIRDVSGGPTRRREYLPVPTPVSGGFSSFSTPTDFMMSASKFPFIDASFTATANAAFECKITGRLQ